MTVVVRMDDEHAAALDAAILTLQAELATVEKWSGTSAGSVLLVLLIDDLQELRERYREAAGVDGHQVYGDNTKHSLRVIR